MTSSDDQLLETICSVVERVRFRFVCEDDLQRGIEEVLVAAKLNVKREHKLAKTDRIDFLIDTVGVEVKIQDSLTSVTRQMHRYAQYDEITLLVLITTKATHRGIPREMNKKRVCVLYIPPM